MVSNIPLLAAGGFPNVLDGWMIWVGLGALALAVYPALVLRKYVRIMIKILDDIAPEADADARSCNGIKGETVQFRARDGHLLTGTIFRGNADRPQRGLVIFAHEFDSNRRSCLRFCRYLLDHGYDLFAFDFRGNGQSPSESGYRPRQFPSDREHADMLGAIAFISDWLESRQRPRDVGLFGVSRGGGAAILAAADVNCVRAVVTDSAFSSDATMEYMMKRFATIFAKIRVIAENHPPLFWKFLRWLLFRECRRRFNCSFPSVVKAIRKLRHTPVLLIHGARDSFIPTAQSQLLFNNAPGPRRLWIVPRGKHNQSIMTDPAGYQSVVTSFYDEHLYGAPRRSVDRQESWVVELTDAVADSLRAPVPATVRQDAQV